MHSTCLTYVESTALARNMLLQHIEVLRSLQIQNL